MVLSRLRRAAGAALVDNTFRSLARAGLWHPHARPERHGVEVTRDVPYAPTGLREHTLDVYRPTHYAGPRPVVLYVHGGGFRILSKDTHWIMGLAFARRGYLVFNINYRLAPAHPFPAAMEDSARAFAWVLDHAAAHGGDASRLVFAGESAGANLVSSLTLATVSKRDEPWAREVFDRDAVPRATIAACGMLQVTDPLRFKRRKPSMAVWLTDRLEEVTDAYVGSRATPGDPRLDLADPLLVLESNRPFERTLPPFFAFAGTRDPLLDDTRRLARALERRGVECVDRYYPGEVHAFHALVFRAQARECWAEMYAFLQRHAPA